MWLLIDIFGIFTRLGTFFLTPVCLFVQHKRLRLKWAYYKRTRKKLSWEYFSLRQNQYWEGRSTHHLDNTPLHYNASFHGCRNVILLLIIFDTFLILPPNMQCVCSLEPPQWGSSNEIPHSLFYAIGRKEMNTCKPLLFLYKVGK